MSDGRIDLVLEPLAAVIAEHLGPVMGAAALLLLQRSLAARAAGLLPLEHHAGVGQDPHADREARRCYLEAFRQIAPDVFGTSLPDRLRLVERALDEQVVRA